VAGKPRDTVTVPAEVAVEPVRALQVVKPPPSDRKAERSKIARAIEREQHRPVGDPMPADEARKLTDAIRRDAGTPGRWRN
jgi:hypothetical protein